MNDKIKFFVDDKEFTSQAPERTVAELLGQVDLTVEQADLVAPDGVEHRDPGESLEVHDGDKFNTKPRENTQSDSRVIHYEVNGEAQTTTANPLTAGAILERAGRAASINVDDLKSYYLENIETERRYNDLAEEIVVKDGDRFLAVHRGRTPVA